MNFDMREPCDNCPFRNDGAGIKLAGTARARDIVSSIVDRQEQFPCHKTVDYDGDDEGHVGPKAQHCAGALILLEKMGRPNQMMRIAERLGYYDASKLNMNAQVVDSKREFISLHSRRFRNAHREVE